MRTIKSFLITGLFVFVIYGGDMRLTLDDGRGIVLHEDSTWTYGGNVGKELTEDIPVTLTDGRTIMVNQDFTWHFGVRPSDKIDKHPNLKSITVTGMAHGKDLKEATARANSMAIDRLTRRIQPLAGAKATYKKLSTCVTNEEKDVENSNKFTTEWNVNVKMTLVKEAIESILECAQAKTAKKEKNTDSTQTDIKAE